MKVATVDDVRHAIRPLMDGFLPPWCVAGGWAIDLFLGRVTRPHADLELAVFRRDQSSLHAHFRGWRFRKVADGHLVDWDEDEHLQLPTHEIHVTRAGGSPTSIEFLLNERDADDWIYRRNGRVRTPVGRAMPRADSGLPILAPEIVLLFKSKSPRPKDQDDFAAVLAALGPDRRRWLGDAIAMIRAFPTWM